MSQRLPPAVRQWRALDPRNRRAKHEGHRILTCWRWARGQWQEIYWSPWELEDGAPFGQASHIQALIESHLIGDRQQAVNMRQHGLNEARKALAQAEAAVVAARAAIAAVPSRLF
jgi:hypothetical protein